MLLPNPLAYIYVKKTLKTHLCAQSII